MLHVPVSGTDLVGTDVVGTDVLGGDVVVGGDVLVGTDVVVGTDVLDGTLVLSVPCGSSVNSARAVGQINNDKTKALYPVTAAVLKMLPVYFFMFP